MSRRVWMNKLIMILFILMSLFFLISGVYDFALQEFVLSELIKSFAVAAILLGVSLNADLFSFPINSPKTWSKARKIGPAYLSDSLLFGGLIAFGVAYFL